MPIYNVIITYIELNINSKRVFLKLHQTTFILTINSIITFWSTYIYIVIEIEKGGDAITMLRCPPLCNTLYVIWQTLDNEAI